MEGSENVYYFRPLSSLLPKMGEREELVLFVEGKRKSTTREIYRRPRVLTRSSFNA